MRPVDLIGYAAGTLTTLSFLPQVLKVAFWIAYGVLNRDWPVIIANVVTLTLASIILGFKFRYPT
jgi:MtN3 and saliva related transmembrane protein